MPGTIRVLIISDHLLFRVGLCLILSREEGITIVGEAAHGPQALDVMNTLQPDVVLFDISLSGIDGLQAIRLLKHNSPATTLLILTTKKNDVLICQALRAGARGSLAQDASVADLTRAMQAVHRGELWVERQLMARFLEEAVGARSRGKVHPLRSQRALTVREQEILRFLGSGETNKKIAQALYISERTVKSHVSNIFQKLHITCRSQAVLHAVTAGLWPDATRWPRGSTEKTRPKV